MHELSIVAAVLEQLAELRRQHAGARFTRVGLRVGELAGVDVDCLRFGFECSVKETEWEPLALEIEQIARRQLCPGCSFEFPAEQNSTLSWDPDLQCDSSQSTPFPTFAGVGQMWAMSLPFTACPRCGEAVTRTIAGEELQIAFVEVETSELESSEVEER